MKEKSRKLCRVLKTAAYISAAYYCMRHSGAVGEAVSEAAGRCLSTVIPSLYAMMIVSGLIIKSGLLKKISRYTGSIGRVLFGMNGEEAAVFLFSMVAGYPVGARMIGELYVSGRIGRRRAELLCGLCFGAGPAFVFGCISRQLYGSEAVGRTILISTAAANILLALMMSPYLRRSCVMLPAKENTENRQSIFVGCTISAGRAMAEVCFMIMAFAVIAGMLGDAGIFGLFGRYGGAARAVLDVTAVGGFPRGDYTLLPLICGLVSFGGVCVAAQTAAVNSGSLSVAPMLIIRVISGAASYGICRLIMPFTLKGEVVSAAAVRAEVCSVSSPVPSVMLLLMTLILIRDAGTIKPR